ncbi:amylosucrase [Actinoplanes sp. NPDC051633]|uniref:amylosucrase n=1 Tax=Actinoplanes sp. NPDC051633 TaxID=3155670 RepID=UPI0034346CC7
MEIAVRRRAADAFERLRPALEAEAGERLGRAEAVAFLARLETSLFDIFEPLEIVYGSADLDRFVRVALDAAAARPPALRELDRRREIDAHWYQRARMVGYVCYADRFAGTLANIPDKLDYLAELGVTYLHLMPLLKPRPGENDGGYAVADYRSVDPRLGTMDDLSALADALRARDMSLCVDLVLNHTAKEHPWAAGWLAGDPAYENFYMSFPDREMPDAYERTIDPVFPDRAPGSFTFFEERGEWIWTTFWSYQWDLDYSNPAVFEAMLETILWLANRGVDIFRLDAVPFMWKRLGTTCMNQPEVHRIVQAMHALTRLAAPGVIFKAEAIVAPDDLVPYLGGHDRYRPECELAYHNQLMVMLWSSLATKDARLMAQSLRRMRPIPASSSWCTYVRGHDDIGWAVSAQDAAAVGWDWWNHRNFLNAFFSGRFPGSFARGALFQENPETGDARISGTAASLCGFETDDPVFSRVKGGGGAADGAAIRRLTLLYSVAFAFGGIPLIYMGDELAMRNDHTYLDDPALADDNRWMHRPHMDWAAAARRHDPATVEGRVFAALRQLVRARKDLLALRTGGEIEVLGVDDPAVFAWRRRHPRSGTFIGLANFAEEPRAFDAAAIGRYGWLETALSSDGPLEVREGRAHLPALGFTWLIER